MPQISSQDIIKYIGISERLKVPEVAKFLFSLTENIETKQDIRSGYTVEKPRLRNSLAASSIQLTDDWYWILFTNNMEGLDINTFGELNGVKIAKINELDTSIINTNTPETINFQVNLDLLLNVTHGCLLQYQFRIPTSPNPISYPLPSNSNPRGDIEIHFADVDGTRQVNISEPLYTLDIVNQHGLMIGLRVPDSYNSSIPKLPRSILGVGGILASILKLCDDETGEMSTVSINPVDKPNLIEANLLMTTN